MEIGNLSNAVKDRYKAGEYNCEYKWVLQCGQG
jgi:hypothetical protein